MRTGEIFKDIKNVELFCEEFFVLGFELRRLTEDDDISPLTLLLREAYQRLADLGLRYTATWQSDEITRSRASRGECYLLLDAGEYIATVTLEPTASKSKGSAWFAREGVASFHQFAVSPRYQGKGLGGQILNFIESRAAQLGACELALDTAEPAAHLTEMYEKRGYRFVEFAQWEETNYRSVIMSKVLKKI
jgi:GNAT superfamily N-acetyltransferase